MKIVVSYISSIFDREETIKRIDKTSAYGIHVDLMDGLYVPTKNFDLTNPSMYLESVSKPLDIHLMVQNPSSYLDCLYNLKPECIYIHPETENNPFVAIDDIKEHGVLVGIAINPDEKINKYDYIFPHINRVLLMSVTPGLGGQKFMDITPSRLNELKKYQALHHFEIIVDGGINDETIKLVSDADLVVCGSFICNNEDYEKQISLLN